jgi:hypothetical protein
MSTDKKEYWWTVKVTIRDTSNNEIATLEGWDLNDTTLDRLQIEVDEAMAEIEEDL